MIQQSSQAWQRALANAVSDLPSLLTQLQLSAEDLMLCDTIMANFPLRVPQSFIDRMRPGDPNDPLLKQILPVQEEQQPHPGYTCDPLNEHSAIKHPGLLHKYHGRALLTVTGACAVHCRYCFRRHFSYADNHPLHHHWTTTLDYLKQQTDITEVILSGGDPLLLKDQTLLNILTELANLPNITRLRLHSRVPIVLPERLTPALIELLADCNVPIVMVIHSNHPNEINHSVQAPLQQAKQAGLTLLNQSVLLHGINHHANTLIQLSERLFDCGVLPYYLHLLDKVQGAAHFAVNEATAIQLIQQLTARLPGYLVPKLVKEVANAPAKQAVV